MAHKITNIEMIDFKKNIILCQSPDKPHKSIILHLNVINQLVGGLRLERSIRVIDQLGRIRYTGDHLNLAVDAYNKLYNE
jgi:hypothetical protein